MKIHIVFPFQDGPYGGGNQFLKALREEFRKKNCYTEIPNEANIFLFNSFQDIRPVIQMKRKFPNTPFVHRIDGPISLYRNNKNHSIDHLIFSLNEAIADATVFQSHFSMIENKKLGLPKKIHETIIVNAPDRSIFFKKDQEVNLENRKIKLISTSWSSNTMKGFETYSLLDQYLDTSKYEYIFVGNTPVEFKKIITLPPQPSKKLAELLRSSDIYITASKKDPCSNSLIEALSCGLPVVAINDGGHPELIQRGGELFNSAEEVFSKVEKILKNYLWYKKNIPIFSIDEKAKLYEDFFYLVLDDQRNGNLETKKVSLLQEMTFFIKSFVQ